MKKTSIMVAAMLMTGAFANTAIAGDGKFVLGANIGSLSIGSQNQKAFMYEIGLGYKLPWGGDQFYSELQVRSAISNKASQVNNNVTSEVSAFPLLSGLYKFGVYATPHLLAYGLVGYAKGTFQVDAFASGLRASGSATKSDVAFGAGVNYGISHDRTAGIEYIQYVSNTSGLLFTMTRSF